MARLLPLFVQLLLYAWLLAEGLGNPMRGRDVLRVLLLDVLVEGDVVLELVHPRVAAQELAAQPVVMALLLTLCHVSKGVAATTNAEHCCCKCNR